MGGADDRMVCVFGSGEAPAGSPACALAGEVGRVLAGLGCGVANGGYGGTMEAVSRAAAQAGAEVVGVTCRLWRSRPNAFLTRTIETRDLFERVSTLIALGTSGYVVLPGGTGTLMELSAVWELSAKGHAPGRPVVCLGPYWRPLVELMARSHPEAAGRVRFASAPAELERHFGAGGGS